MRKQVSTLQADQATLKTDQSSNGSASTSATTSSNLYNGWKTGILQYEQISYMYPSTWALSGNSQNPSQQNVQTDLGNIFYPGEDTYTLKSPNDNEVELNAGPGAAFIPFQTTGTSLTIPFIGSSHYINFGTYNSGVIPSNFFPTEACLASTKPNAYITSKNITYKDGSTGVTAAATDGFCYMPNKPETVAAYESDPDFATAKLIFESMKYTN